MLKYALSCYMVLLLGNGLLEAAAAPVDFKAVFITSSRIADLQQKIQDQTEPAYEAYRQVKAIADQHLDRQASVPEHWYVPGFYRDAQGHRESKGVLQEDANIAYQLALVHRITEDERYAKAAARLAHQWATGIETMSQEDDSTLSFSYHFPAMICAADLIRESPHWTDQHEDGFKTFLREQALPMNTMDRANNWGNWGLVLVMGIAAYLEDEALFNQGVERWKYLIEHQIAEDGHMPHEVHRSEGQRGIWYTHFSLFPQTIAAEVARVNGVNLFSYQSPSQRTLKMAYEKVAQWADQPETFPYLKDSSKPLRGVEYVSYFEVLYPRWPNAHARNLLERLRPLSANHSAPALTLTHGVPLSQASQSED